MFSNYTTKLLTVTLPRISRRLAVLGKLDGSPKKIFQKQSNTSFRVMSFVGYHQTNKQTNKQNAIINKVQVVLQWRIPFLTTLKMNLIIL